MAVKRWLAVRRWRLFGAAVALVVIRVAGAAALRFAGGDDDGGGWPAAVLTGCDGVIIAVAVIAAIAFVQYGRIYRARVPTE